MARTFPRGEMPFLDHLEELRWRLLWSLLAIAIGSVAGFFIVQHFDVLGLLKRPIAKFVPGGRLLFTSPTEPLLLTFKLGIVVGLVSSLPVVVWHAWAFLSPALFERERKMVVPFGLAAVVMFAAGVALAYFLVLPLALRVLFGFQSQALAPIITVQAYLSFATMVMLAFGVIFELPLLLILLVLLDVVTPEFLARHRRFALIGNAILSAVLTPADLVSMLLMMIPIALFYEGSIVVARVLKRRRRAERSAEVAAAETV